MIYYLIPESKVHSGGVNLLHNHVRILQGAGLPVKAIVLSEHACVPCEVGDTVVIPEIRPDLANRVKLSGGQIRCVSIVLNPLYAFMEGDPAFGEFAITNSPYTAEILESMGVPTRSFLTAVRPEFYPEQKKRQICWIQRKSGQYIEPFKRALRMISPTLVDTFSWVPIIDMSDEEYAATIRQSMVFLSMSLAEGWSGAMYEAMRCRTLVCCFPICQPYILKHVVSSGTCDFVDLARRLAWKLSAFTNEEHREGAIVGMMHLDKAYNASLAYTLASESASIIQLWTDYLNAQDPSSSIASASPA